MDKILISALEPSANLHLSEILKNQEFKICGIFDKNLDKNAIYDSKEFSAMGFFQVLPLILKAKRALDEMVELSFDCKKALLIDSPDFNILLAKKLKRANPGIKIIYYILPQVWAWREARARVVDKNCDYLASIWPFEQTYFKNATYVGNPLLDEIKEDSSIKKEYISFLPGSRKNEIKSLMPTFKEVAKKIGDKKKYLVVAKNFKDDLEIFGDISEFELIFDTYKALNSSHFAFICSGTATMEAALLGTPFVLCYKTSKIDYLIAKSVINLKHIGLANIIFDFLGEDELNKELIQSEVNVKNLLKAYENIDRTKFKMASKRLKEYLKFGSAKNLINLLKG